MKWLVLHYKRHEGQSDEIRHLVVDSKEEPDINTVMPHLEGVEDLDRVDVRPLGDSVFVDEQNPLEITAQTTIGELFSIANNINGVPMIVVRDPDGEPTAMVAACTGQPETGQIVTAVEAVMDSWHKEEGEPTQEVEDGQRN